MLENKTIKKRPSNGLTNGVNFAFFGTSQFATPVLDTLTQAGFKPSLIVTTPDKPAGRGLKSFSSPVKLWAQKQSVPFLQPENLSDPSFIQKLKDLEYSLIIVTAYGKIIPKSVLDIPQKGVLNVHPSLLPRWRGADPIRSAILAGDKKTGVTIMLVDKKMDHGPILASSQLPITNSHAYEILEKELAKLGGKLLVETIPKWLAGKTQPREQDHSQSLYTKKITKEDGCLSWNEDVNIIERKIRALNPWPGTFTFWKSASRRRIRILEGTIIPLQKKLSPGTVLKSDSGIAVAAKSGAILVNLLQIEGKKPMSAKDFLNGYPNIIGSILG